MPVYYYQGKSKDETAVAGSLEAPSRAVATLKLRQQGIWIETLSDQATPSPAQAAEDAPRRVVWSPFYGLCPVSAGAMGNLFDQIGSMYRAGISLHTLASDLAERTSSGRLRGILLEATPRVAAGEPLSACLATFPQVFPEGIVGMLRTGELTGAVDDVAHDLAEDFHAEQRVWWLLLIPKIYFSITLLLAILVPSFPWMILHGMRWWVNHVITDILPWVGLAFAAYLLYRMVWHVPAFVGIRDRLAFSLPVWSVLTRRVALTRFYRSLELAIRAGVDFPTAMNFAAQAAGNRVIARKLREAETKMRAGMSVPEALAPCGFITREAQGMLSTATRAGTFDEALPHLAQQTKASRDNTIRVLRFSGVALAYVITSIIVLLAAAKGYTAIYQAQLQRAGFEDLLQ